MSVTYLNYNASGTEIIDEALVINTAGSQQLVHDHVISIEVWTGEGKTGSQLIASTDYVLGDYDSFYKTYNSITFLTHNGDTVYCTYLTKGDKNSADDVNSKADKVASPTAGNFAGIDANGNLTDSTSKAADFATSGHVHSAATTAVAGFMSADDKTKLTGIAENANNYTHPNHSGDVTSTADGATAYNNTVPVAKGGTGQTSYTDGQLLIGNTTGSTLAKATLTQGTGITITNGAGSITIANASPNATHTGDVTGGSALTIANDAVTNAKMANMVANSLKGNATADSADPSDISIAANKFPARASTGNLEAKTITDFGLGLVGAADAAAGRTALGALGSANITQTITNGVTDKAPSEDAVYDALALKAPLDNPTFTGQATFTNPKIYQSYSASDPIPYNLTSGIFCTTGFVVPAMNNFFYMAHIRQSVTLTNLTNPSAAKLFDGDYAHHTTNRVPVRVGETAGVSTISIVFNTAVVYSQGIIYVWFYYDASHPMPSAVKARIKSAGSWQDYIDGTSYHARYGLACYAIKFGYYSGVTEMEIEVTNNDVTGECSISEIEYCKYRDVSFSPLMSKGATNTIYGQQIFYNSSNNVTAVIYPETGSMKLAKIYPTANSTTALQLTKADGTTPVMTMDTTNSRIGIGKTPTETLDVSGNIKGSGYLELSEMSEPDAGAADTARLFLQDNGSGKTQICVRFSSGATQVLSTQP